jgi:3-methyladenine DNA glycosylase/8-oxoguanine DNA glycosylase
VAPAGRGGLRTLEVEVRPPWPYRLRPRLGGDGVAQRRGSVVSRLLATPGGRVVVHVWQPQSERVVLRAAEADPQQPAGREALELAIERMRFALAVDDDLTEFARTFRGDPLIGEIIHQRPWHRPKRRPWPWEALAWAVTEQLIESTRAAEIQRRVVRRWGDRLEPDPDGAWRGPGPLRDVPSAERVAGVAPAELAAMDLAPSRAIALIRCAREVARGRVDLGCASAAADLRLARIPGIGPWTLQVLGLDGRGDPDSLPAGDLAYIKLVGSLAGLGRRATVEEVDEYFAGYAPFRGLAGSFALARWHGAVAAGPPLRLAA